MEEMKDTMEEWKNNDSSNTDGMEFQDLNDDQSSIRQVVLAVLLGVLILANIVLVVLYFALGDDVFSGKGATSESTAPVTSSEAEQETQPSTEAASEAESETETVTASSEAAQSSEASSTAASSSAAETKAESSAAASSEAQSSAAASSSAANTQTSNTQEAFGVVFDMIEPVSVTAKIHTNIRSYPGVRSDDDLLGAIDHGEWVTKIGVGRNGWSMVEYNGTVGYAVDSYLTTDANWTE